MHWQKNWLSCSSSWKTVYCLLQRFFSFGLEMHIARLADIVVSVWATNPASNSPPAHIQSEIQGTFSVTPRLKSNQGLCSGSCGYLNVYCRFKFSDWLGNPASLVTYCNLSLMWWKRWLHALWGFNRDENLNAVPEAFHHKTVKIWRYIYLFC